MDRTTLLWSMVAFFGAFVAFQGIRDFGASQDWSTGAILAVEVGALVAIVLLISAIVRRRRG